MPNPVRHVSAARQFGKNGLQSGLADLGIVMILNQLGISNQI